MTGKLKSRKLFFILPLLLLLVTGIMVKSNALAVLFNRQTGNEKTAPVVQTVAVAEATRQQVERTITLTGSIQAGQEAPVSAKIAGRVKQLNVDNGTRVTAGQPLVLLEDSEFQNAVNSARAAVKRAEAGLNAARRNYERIKILYENSAVARKDLEDAETALNLAEADYESAIATLASAEESLRNTVVSAPIGGVVANRSVNPGQVVSPGLSLLTVMDIDTVYLTVNVEQEQIGRIKSGQAAEVTVDAYHGQTFSGRVAIINPAISPAARTFTVKIQLANHDHLLKPGMFARATLKTGEREEVTAIDQSAVFSREGEFYVFAVDETPAGLRAKRQKVEIGQALDRLVEIKSGLTPGQRIIISNVNKLKDGDPVSISTIPPTSVTSN